MKFYCVALTIFAATLIGCSEPEPPASSVVKIVPVLADAVPATGQKLAAKACQRCHGKDGLNPHELRPYLAGQSGEYLYKSMLDYQQATRKHEDMQAVLEGLSEQDLKNLAAYYADLRGTWSGAGKGFPTQAASPAAGGSAKRGKAMATPCIDCHGSDGNSLLSGVPSLAGLEAEYFLSAFENYFAERRQGTIMKHFKHAVSKQELKDLGAFYASQPRKANTFPIPGNITKGKAAATPCAGCHGSQGQTIMPDIPSLAAQNAEYLIKAISAYRNGQRQHSMMRAAVLNLEDSTIRDLSSYYASLKPLATKKTKTKNIDDDPMAIAASLSTTCAGCHGDHGNSTVQGTPSINRQPPDYFMAALQSYADGQRSHDMMKTIVQQLSLSDREKLGFFYAQQEPTASKLPAKGDIAAAQELASGCNGCHGNDGNSTDKTVPSLAGQDATYLLAALQTYANGKRVSDAMQNAVKDLQVQDLTNLAAFYAGKTPIAQAVKQLDSPLVLSEQCDRCHGPDGRSEQPAVPHLASQVEAYLIKALTDYRNGNRKNSMMHAMTVELTHTEIESMAHYYASK